MLSFIYQLVQCFESTHGFPPNLLYLNRKHLAVLKEQMDDIQDLDLLVERLGMDIVVSNEALHPHVAWTRLPWRKEAV